MLMLEAAWQADEIMMNVLKIGISFGA